MNSPFGLLLIRNTRNKHFAFVYCDAVGHTNGRQPFERYFVRIGKIFGRACVRKFVIKASPSKRSDSNDASKCVYTEIICGKFHAHHQLNSARYQCRSTRFSLTDISAGFDQARAQLTTIQLRVCIIFSIQPQRSSLPLLCVLSFLTPSTPILDSFRID